MESIEDNYFALFDEILNNTASATTEENFKVRLKKDDRFRAEFKDYYKLHEAIVRSAGISFKEENTNFSLQTLKPRKVIPLKVFSIAASFLLFFCTTLAYNHFNYWEKINSRYSVVEVKQNIFLGEKKIDINQNEGLINKSQKFIQEKQYTKAIEALSQVKINSTNVYDDYFVAQYNIAILYLRLKEKNKTINVLRSLIKRSEIHYMKDQAAILLKDLSRKSIFYF